jgi:hypothetical protein
VASFGRMKVRLKLVEDGNVNTPLSLKSFANKVFPALQLGINSYVKNRIDRIEPAIRGVLERALKESPTYQSIVAQDGMLRAHLGIENPNIIDDIVEAWLSQIKVSIKFGNDTIKKNKVFCNIIIEAIRADFEEILKHPSSVYTYDVSPKKGGGKRTIPWLEYLLKRGGDIIVTDFAVVRKSFDKKWSRTGLALMFPSKRGWTVPLIEPVRGQIDDNFVTYAIMKYEKYILNSLKAILL